MRTFTLTCMAVLVVAGLAFADSTTRSDPKGDSERGEFDLRSAAVDHAGRDIVKHTIKTYNAIGNRERSIRLDVGTGGGRPCCMVARFEGKAGLYEFTRSGPKRVGPAKFTRHSGKKFSYTFNLKYFGLPSQYRWQWAVQVKDSFDPADTLPNKGMVTHNVDTGH